jgi:tripartite-type tricarboxylate transporter receptor subunit TctC
MRFKSKLLKTAIAVLVAGISFGAGAQSFPSQDIHFICAFPPGTGADTIVRYFAEKMRPLVGRNIIVENRTGAGGNIAIEYLARSKPNGETVLITSAAGLAANMWIYKQPPVADVGKSIQVAATINRQPFMLTVDAASPYKTAAALTAAMKVKGNKASYGTAGAFGTVVGEYYKLRTGVTAVEVNYKAAIDTVNDLSSGAIDYSISEPVLSLAQQRAGRWRILGVSTGERLQASASLPTLKEQGIDMNIVGWWAAMVPAGTPSDIVAQLNTWFVSILSLDETRTFLANLGGDPLIENPAVAQERLLNDVIEWKEYIRLAKIPKLG